MPSGTDILQLLAFGLAVLLVCLFALTVSGMFPGEYRPRALRGPIGSALLFGSIAVTGALALHLVYFAVQHVAWPAAVIVGGLTLLASPFVHEVLPRGIQEGAGGALGLGLGALILHGLLTAV
jgi:hypothetical protein